MRQTCSGEEGWPGRSGNIKHGASAAQNRKSGTAPSSCETAKPASASSAIAPKKNAPEPPPDPTPPGPGPGTDRPPPPKAPDSGQDTAPDPRAIACPAAITTTREAVTDAADVDVVDASAKRSNTPDLAAAGNELTGAPKRPTGRR